MDGAAMRVDDLLGDGEAEPGMGAELFAGRTLAVEALEDRLELVLGDAGAFILDHHHHGIALAPRADMDGGARRAERERVDDEVAEHLDEPPFDSEFGQKIYKNVSKAAWDEWLGRQKMLLNEYRLQPWTREAQEFLVEQMNEFFFGEGGSLPKEYVAPTH